MALYDIKTDYNGQTVIIKSDPDRIVFINHDSILWENGVPLTLEEKADFIGYYYHHMMTPDGKIDRLAVTFMDGQERYRCGYGLEILVDRDGEPQFKIEDGKILSTRTVCICEEKYNRNFGIRSRKEYEAFRTSLVSSGIFTFGGKHGNCYEYRCTSCGDVWTLPCPQQREVNGIFSMNNKKYKEAYMRAHGIVSDSRLALYICGAILLVIAFTVILLLLVTS